MNSPVIEGHDVIFGHYKITEPVLVELINHKVMQRLKGVNQFLPERYYHQPGFSRYEHCFGAMLLVRKLGGDLVEQTKALLHDASHTAFSHTIDWALGTNEAEDYQDKTHVAVLSRFGVPEILIKHGLDPAAVMDIESPGLLEREIPDLCADRLDYALREFYHLGNRSIVQNCIDSLIVRSNEIIFNNQGAAQDFADNYMHCQLNHWTGYRTALSFYIMAQAIKEGLEKGIVTMDDFYEDDEHVLAKFEKTDNIVIKEVLRILSSDLEYEDNFDNPQIKRGTKFRHVDPKFITDGKILRLTEVNPRYKTFLNEQRELNTRGISVDLINESQTRHIPAFQR